MTHKRILVAIVALALVVSCAELLTVVAGTEEVDVVVSKANNVVPLSREEVRRIFVGEKSSWPGGRQSVRPATLAMANPRYPQQSAELEAELLPS